MQVIEVYKSYYMTILNTLSEDKRTFIDKDVKADKYYLIFDHEPIGGFTINSTGYINGLFSLKPREGNSILNKAINQIKLVFKPSTIKVFCIGDFLKEFYYNFGFNVVTKYTWDKDLAPTNWSYTKYGTPTLYIMELDENC